MQKKILNSEITDLLSSIQNMFENDKQSVYQLLGKVCSSLFNSDETLNVTELNLILLQLASVERTLELALNKIEVIRMKIEYTDEIKQLNQDKEDELRYEAQQEAIDDIAELMQN